MSSDRPSSDSRSKNSPDASGSTERPAIGRELQPTIDSSSQGVYSNPTIAQPQMSASSHSNPSSFGRTHLTAPGDFGKYKLLKILGQGGMGAVYMADDPTLDRKVALKIPLVDPQERSAILDRFKREAKAVAPLRHPSICPVFEVGEIDGRPYMTMAYIEGKPLSDFIDPKKPLPIKSALTMTAKIAAALDYAHKKGVIHRDLKPANIMIDERREPVIMDFGLARRSSHPQETKLTQAGSVMGTPAYMPPEQARGDADLMGPASDIYSLGVILFEMLSGRVPFEGDLFSVMIKLGSDAPPALPSLRSSIDPAVDALCQKALAKNPIDRYASMADFGKAISAYLKQQTTTGSMLQTVRESSSFSSELPAPMASIASAPVTSQQAAAPAESPTSSRSRWLYPVLGLTILTMGAAGAWVIVRDKDGNEVAKVRVPDGGNVTIETQKKEDDPLPAIVKPPASLRELAVWTIERGGKVEQVHQGQSREYVKIDQLPTHFDDNAYIFPKFNGVKSFGDAEAAVIAKVPFSTPISVANTAITDAGLRKLANVSRSVLDVTGTQISGEGFDAFKPGSVGTLVVQNCKFTPAGWKAIAQTGESTSRIWYLDGSNVDDLVLAELVALHPEFRDMHLGKTLISDSGVSSLAKLPKLRFLNLRSTAITDAGLKTLEPITSLERVNLSETKVTAAGVAAFQKALPQCKVEWSGRTRAETSPSEVGNVPAIAKAPFSPEEAANFQATWSKHLNAPVEMTNSIGMKFMLIPPGEFMMGTSQHDADSLIARDPNSADLRAKIASEGPQHKVRITKPFYTQTTEVTVGQFRKFVAATGYQTEGEKDGKGGFGPDPGEKNAVQRPEFVWSNKQFSPTDDHPVVFVTWNDASALAKWLSKMEGKTYRLPTEAEWEYCCRSGTETWWYCGAKEADLAGYAWSSTNNLGNQQPVARKKPNAFGLFDLHGNVWEWCADWAVERYYAGSPTDDPPGPSAGSSRIVRGGSFDHNATIVRSGRRHWYAPTSRNRTSGFRLSIDISKTTETAATNPPTIDPKPETKTAATPSAAPPMLVAPFSESTAKASQELWSKHLHRPVKEKNSIGMELMLIPPGEFTMGTSPEDADTLIAGDPNNADWRAKVMSEVPAHKVRITKSFYLQTTETTVGQFRKFVTATGYKTEAEKDGIGGAGPVPGEKNYLRRPEYIWSNAQFSPTDDHPVVFVSWKDAMEFVKWLSVTEGKTYRLPTEAQWEYCCRSGTETWRFSGNDQAKLADYAWYSTKNYAQPVGRKKPNAFGLFDMHGNVDEWCADWADAQYYARSPIDDPPGPPSGSARILRGSHFAKATFNARSARRQWEAPTQRILYNGFRLALDITDPEERPAPPSSAPPLLVAPFPESTAKASQEAWSKRLNRPVKEKNSIGMEFMLIPPGEFMMGTTQEEVDKLIASDPNNPDWRAKLTSEVPPHKVRITKPFYMQTTEVTLGQFRKFIEATGYKTEGERDGKGGHARLPGEKLLRQRPEHVWSNAQFSPTDDHPVVFVSWNDATEFVKWLSKSEGKLFRLPTEAQWEYCCRSGTETWWSSGAKEAGLEDYAWYAKNSAGSTQPVGRKQPNAFGLFDLHGNVWEWSADWTDERYYARSPTDDPHGPSDGSSRVYRGGHLENSAVHVRSSGRYWIAPTNRNRYDGFRIALDIANLAETAPLPASTPPMLVAPFTETTAKAGQEAWSKHVSRPVKEKNSIGMEFMLIPPGEFMMGTSQADADRLIAGEPNNADWRAKVTTEVPQHKVRITKPFYMQSTELTVGQFRKFVEAAGYKTEAETDGKGGFASRKEGWVQHPEHIWSNAQLSPTDDFPAVLLAWNDAMAFVNWLSQQERKVYRLPTEAQWEYCCRSGTETLWYSGDTEAGLGDYAWYKKNDKGIAHPVGTKKPNAFGLFDLHGNIWEWCSDFAGESYYARSPTDDPPGPAQGSQRIKRDGLFRSTADYIRSSRRSWDIPTSRTQNSGFRIVLDVNAEFSPDSAALKSSPISTPAPLLAKSPFSADEAKRFQEAWSKHLNRPVQEKNSIGMELMLIPPGEFMMGIADDELAWATSQYSKMSKTGDSKPKESALPRHKVRITRPFYMQTTEATVGQFRKFVEATGYKTEGEKSGKGGAGPVSGESDWKHRPEYIWSYQQFSPTDDYPVVFVTWNDANAFAEWLGDSEGKVYKLPTEAQWEYCCRSGTETWWYSGNTEVGLGNFAWYSVNGSAGTHPVGQKKANAFGLFDLHGNVYEWCADWGDAQYYSVSPTDDPPGPATGKSRVLRGGAYKLGAISSRSSRRDWYSPTDRIRYNGFRLILDLATTTHTASVTTPTIDQKFEKKIGPAP